MAAAPGTDGAPNQPPAEAEGRTSLLADPAAPTRVLQPGKPITAEQPATPATHPDAHGFTHPGHVPYTAGQPEPAAPFSAGHPDPGAPYVVHDPAAPAQGPTADLPPGLDPDELAAAPVSSARRGRLRKRVAFLRAARELLLRDLGGFAYELHRTAGDIEHEAHRRLRATKLDRLTRIDAELHELEERLDDVRRNVVVREPGVGGECPECGELFGSDAHYCSHCGLPLTESARRALARAASAAPEEVPAAPAPIAAAPAAVAAGPGPVVAPAAPPADQPTQEIPPQDAQGTEFEWPQRAPAPNAEAAVAGDETARGAQGGGETAAGEDAPETRGDVVAGGESGVETRGDVAAGGESGVKTRGDVAADGESAPETPDEMAAGGEDAPETRGEFVSGGERASETSGDAAMAGGQDETGAGEDRGDGSDAARADGPSDAASGAETATGEGGAKPGDASARDEAPGIHRGEPLTGGTASSEPAAGRTAAGTPDSGEEAPPRDAGGEEDAPNGRTPKRGLFSRSERGS